MAANLKKISNNTEGIIVDLIDDSNEILYGNFIDEDKAINNYLSLLKVTIEAIERDKEIFKDI
jgi:hypothetical protein